MTSLFSSVVPSGSSIFEPSLATLRVEREGRERTSVAGLYKADDAQRHRAERDETERRRRT